MLCLINSREGSPRTYKMMKSMIIVMLCFAGVIKAFPGPPLPPWCKKVYCSLPTCNNAKIPVGKCCPVCPGTNGYNGNNGDNGDNGPSNKPVDPCSNVNCLPAPCQNPYIPRGKCCPRCPKPLQPVNKCALVKCVPAPCQNPYTPPGMCCPQCPPSPPVDPCAATLCAQVYCDGAYVPVGSCCPVCPPKPVDPCATKVCGQVICDGAYIPAGSCCPVCPPPPVTTCTVNGIIYQSGSEVPTSNACDVCVCLNGNVNCVAIQCPVPQCSNAFVPPGKCCAECPSTNCEVNGYIYEHGKELPVGDVCEKCECYYGSVTCQKKVCPDLKCDESYTPVGECCAKCPDTRK